MNGTPPEKAGEKTACGLSSILSGKAHRDACAKCRLEYYYLKSVSGAKKTLQRFMQVKPQPSMADESKEIPEALKAKQRKIIAAVLIIVGVLLLLTLRPSSAPAPTPTAKVETSKPATAQPPSSTSDNELEGRWQRAMKAKAEKQGQ